MIHEERVINHFHLFCGLGGGALGFNRGRAEYNGLRGRFQCIGGVDVSPAAIRDFDRLSGARGTVLDMFDREQYAAFHGHQPPPDWHEAGPAEMQRAAGYQRPNIVFLSAPCKGFSGLLSESRSKTGKYQALNRLTLRGMFLMLEAWADDPPELVIFENVPRIATRGRALLDQINSLLRHYGYAVAETFHDCGEIGGLAQSRKRFLLVARHIAKVPPFLYEPPKRSLRAVGEILDKMPLPGDMRGGPMHSVPNLQWKTWVRLAFVEAGSDWRSLNKLNVVDGKLADYLLVPGYRNDCYGVNRWDSPTGTITGDARPMKGAFAVADPRHPNNDFSALAVESWDETAGTITGQRAGNNLFIADPRCTNYRPDAHENKLRVSEWDSPSRTVTGGTHVQSGGLSVADPRLGYGPDTHKNVYRIVGWDEASQTIGSGHGPSSGGMCVADPRHDGPAKFNDRYRVVKYDGPSQAVTGASGQGQCIADPRFPNSQGEHTSKYVVQSWDEPSRTVTGSDRIGSGALCIADPRPAAQRSKGDNYLTNGNYGVIPWDEPCGAVSASAGPDNGRWNVADPRLPEAAEKVVAVIRALDGTWHRPFTTLELAALQSLVDPENLFDLDGNSDSAKRERIGNAVPPKAAQAIADVMGLTLLMAWSGETFMLSALPIWVQPVAVALSVKTPEVQG